MRAWLRNDELDLGKVSRHLESQGRFTLKKRSQAGDKDLKSSLEAWELCHPGFPNRKPHYKLFHFYCISKRSGSRHQEVIAHAFDTSLTQASHFSTLWGPYLLHKGELPRQATENVGPAGSRQEVEEHLQWSPTSLAGLGTVLLTHSNPQSFMFTHTCSSTLKLSELHVHTCLFFPLYPRHPGSGEPLGSTYAFPNLRTDRSRQNRALSSEASQYPLAAISKPTLIWSLAFLLLRPYKEHVSSSLGAKNRRIGTHPCLTACGAHFQVRLPWIFISGLIDKQIKSISMRDIDFKELRQLLI